MRQNQATERKILEDELPLFYCAASLAPMVVHRYREVEAVKNFARPIEGAIEFTMVRNYHNAFASLTPVVEGFIRDVAAHHNVSAGHVRKSLSAAISAMIDEAANGAGVVEEIQQMLRGFKEFFDKRPISHSCDNSQPPFFILDVRRVSLKRAAM